MTDRKELQAQLAEKVKFAEAALDSAKDFANEHGLSFYFAPQYGMGGTYHGGSSEDLGPEPSPPYTDEWYEWDDQRQDNQRGWVSSSENC